MHFWFLALGFIRLCNRNSPAHLQRSTERLWQVGVTQIIICWDTRPSKACFHKPRGAQGHMAGQGNPDSWVKETKSLPDLSKGCHRGLPAVYILGTHSTSSQTQGSVGHLTDQGVHYLGALYILWDA